MPISIIVTPGKAQFRAILDSYTAKPDPDCQGCAPPGSAVAGAPAMPTPTTYARTMAHKAQDKWLNGPGGHYAALVAVEEVVAEVGERCAVESEVGVCQFNDDGARCAHSACAAKRVIARRIRTLFAPAAPPDGTATPTEGK